MRRRRRTRAPYFRVPTPRNAITGLPKELRRPRSVPYTMVFRVQSISDDYLVCEGWSPVSHTWLSNIIVAVPYTLRVNPNGSIRYPDYTDSYTKVSVGERAVVRTPGFVARTEVIEPAYFVGDLITAVRMEGIIGEEVLKPALSGIYWSQPLEVKLPSDMPMGGMTQDDKPVFWMDVNVAGRQWFDSDVLAGSGVEASVRQFAKVYTGWVNTKGASGLGSWVSETVDVEECDYDGANTVPGTFEVQTMPHKNLDTALFTGYVIEWAEDTHGNKIIVSSIWDDPFGTIKWESLDTANIRDGWRVCDGASGAPDLKGRFIMHRDTTDSALNDDVLPANSENAIAKTGGKRWKGSSYAFDSLEGVSAQGAGPWPKDILNSGGVDHNTADIKESLSPDVVPPVHDDIRPRFYTMAAIQRYA